MLARGSDAAAAPALEKDGWTYSSAIPPGATHARYTRRRDGREPELLVDESARAEGQPYFRSTDHQTSPAHRWFAWAEDCIGKDRPRICLRGKQKIRRAAGRERGCKTSERPGGA